MIRGEARELIMKLVFQMDAQGNYTNEKRDKYYEEYAPGTSQKEYMNKLLDTIIINLEQINNMIEKYSEHWKIDRLAKVDLSITRVAIAEILYMSDVPNAVAINEAVNMAKKYSTEESSKFINGILGKIEKDNHV